MAETLRSEKRCLLPGNGLRSLDRVLRKHKITAQELAKYPDVRRDLALLLDRSVTFAQLRKVAFGAERKLLKRVSLFDVYEGDKLPEGKNRMP